VCSCGSALKVQKSQTKKVVSLAGVYVARRFVSHCTGCGRVFQNPALRRWVAHRCRTAWDVLVFVGLRLFQDCRTIGQIHAELLARDVPVSESQIARLGQKFILYLALAHRRATPRIKQAMALSGGYILHLDGLHQDDAPALMSGIDGLSRLVLANVKLPSEKAERIAPFLRNIQGDYGDPIACVHDMGTGICKAVNTVFPNIRDFICHFHFLRDVGKDLLDPSYRTLRSCFRQHAFTSRLRELVRQARQKLAQPTDATGEKLTATACRRMLVGERLDPVVIVYALSLWCLQAKKCGNGYGFPFDRPLLAIAERVLDLVDYLPGLLKILPSDDPAGKRLILKLSRKVLAVTAESDFQKAVEELRWRSKLFDRLRRCMRIAEPGGRDGLNDDGGKASMNSIRRGVKKFRRQLDTNEKRKHDPLCSKMAQQIDKYAGKLFADPIQVKTPAGSITVYPQRTNNILEQFFRRLRRDHRRRTGDNRMNRALQTMLADTPLVKNLSNPKYMEILLDGRPDLETLFADLDTTVDWKDLTPDLDGDRILPEFRGLTKEPDLPAKIYEMANAANGKAKSNQVVWQ